MKAVAVRPPKKDSVHLAKLPEPSLSEIPEDRGVLIETLKVGVDATDAEINAGLYGNPPPGSEFLVLGHEVFGRVLEVGHAVKSVSAGDLVTCTVRRPGGSIYDQIGRNDITSEETYYERGINLRHGYLTERFVDDCEFVVRIPQGIAHLHVLAEPMSCAAKAVQQAYEAQRRLQVWSPRVAWVLGSGQIGLLSTLVLRLRGLETYTISRSKKPALKAEIAEGYAAEYVSTDEESLAALCQRSGKPDLIIEATGNSGIAFEAMKYLGLNGAMVWTSVTGGEAQVSMPSDVINLEWVLGNKLLVGSVNGNRNHFEAGIADLALGEAMFPGVTERILTTPVDGLDAYEEMMRLLVEDKTALKVFVNIAE